MEIALKMEAQYDELPELELKDLPPHLEYAFLEGTDKLPVIIAKDLKDEDKTVLLKVLRSHKRAIAWKMSDIKGIDLKFYTHKILMEGNVKPTVQHQRRVNPKIHEVIKKEVIKVLEAGLIYPISDSPWVSPIHCVPKKGGITVIENDDNELIPTRLITGWRVCIDYRKLNDATRKDHFPLPFMDQMLERLAGNEYYCFLDGFSGYFQIPIDLKDQEMTTFTCPYGPFAYRRMPFGLCNAPGTFQKCMYGYIKKSQENHQKQENTNMRNGRAQKKPEMQSQKQEKSKSQSCGQLLGKSKGFSKLRVKDDNSSEGTIDDRDSYVISRVFIGSLKLSSHVDVEKAQGVMDFALEALIKLA
ncbi:reverse transcriptase domain-containing protein [Tanacetum coccineum]